MPKAVWRDCWLSTFCNIARQFSSYGVFGKRFVSAKKKVFCQTVFCFPCFVFFYFFLQNFWYLLAYNFVIFGRLYLLLSFFAPRLVDCDLSVFYIIVTERSDFAEPCSSKHKSRPQCIPKNIVNRADKVVESFNFPKVFVFEYVHVFWHFDKSQFVWNVVNIFAKRQKRK